MSLIGVAESHAAEDKREKEKDLEESYVTSIMKVTTPYEAGAHLVWRASEVIELLSAHESRWDAKKYEFNMRMYEDTKRLLRSKWGISDDVCDACDRAIEGFEMYRLKKAWKREGGARE